MSATDGSGLTLFIANKKITFVYDSSQEVKYKKFLLLSTIIGLGCLSTGGNLVIKVIIKSNKRFMTQ